METLLGGDLEMVKQFGTEMQSENGSDHISQEVKKIQELIGIF